MEDAKCTEVKICVAITAVIVIVALIGVPIIAISGGLKNVFYQIEQFQVNLLSVDGAYKHFFENGNAFTSGRFGCTFDFPNSWGDVARTDEDFGLEKKKGVLETYYWHAQDDEGKFFFLAVADPDLVTEAEMSKFGMVFLGESPNFAYYYKSTEPAAECRSEDYGGLDREAVADCVYRNGVWNRDIKSVILDSFKILK